MLEKVKNAIRANGSASDDEIEGLIAAALAEIQTATGSAPDQSDPLVVQAVKNYAKAYYGYDDPTTAERFRAAFESIKTQLAVVGGGDGDED